MLSARLPEELRERRDLAEANVQRGGKEFCSWTRTQPKEIRGREWGNLTFSPSGRDRRTMLMTSF